VRGSLFVLKERHGAILGCHNLVAIVSSDQLKRCHQGIARGGEVARRGSWGLDPAKDGNGDRHGQLYSHQRATLT
jgi:hypothetical protein